MSTNPRNDLVSRLDAVVEEAHKRVKNFRTESEESRREFATKHGLTV